MSDSSTSRPCCSVGARHDAGAIDEALRAGTPYRDVAGRYGASESGVYRHKVRCLGVRPGSQQTPATGDAQPGGGAASERFTEPVKQPRSSSEAAEAAPAPTYTPYQPRARVKQEVSRPVADVSEAQRVTADRIRTIANLIAVGSWKDRSTVLALAERWHCSEEEVQRLHRIAGAKVRGNRGTITAQRELSVAVVRKIRDDELALAAEYDGAAKEAFIQSANAKKGTADFSAAKTARRMATFARQVALHAQAHIDKLTIAQPHALIQVSVQANPNFEAAWKAVARILEGLYGPTASLRVEEGLAVFEDRGDAGLEEWLSEQAGDGAMMLAEHADGTYG